MILTTEQIQTTIKDFFADKPVNKVWLFGSYARGDADVWRPQRWMCLK